MNRKIFLAVFVCFSLVSFLRADELTRSEQKELSYYPDSVLAEADEYQKSQCRLNVSTPKDVRDLPVFVWFHGGGLTNGKKSYPGVMMKDRIVLVGVGYRLSPKADFPAFLEDAAAAVAWTFANIEKYGGSTKKIFVGGHSAGGYLSSMICMDPRWLKPHNIDRSQIAGLIDISGQVTTHFNVRKMLKYPQPEFFPIIDENAPLFHVAPDLPPVLLVLGDRKMEIKARAEENEFMAATLRAMKHPHVEFYENLGYDHGKVAGAKETGDQIRNFIEKVLSSD